MIPSHYVKMHNLILTATLVFSLSFVTQAAAQEKPFLLDLNTRTATVITLNANGINDSGQVIGDYNSYAYITGPDGRGLKRLDTFGDGNAATMGINNAGKVVGMFLNERSERHIFIANHDG